MENENIQEVQPEINEQETELVLEEETPTEQPAQEIDWRAEALKQKAINQRLSKKVAQPVEKKQDLQTEDNDIRLTVKELQLAEKKRQFGYEHGLSPEEADAVFKLSPNPSKEVLEDPFVKGGLAALRAKKRVAENTPSSSTRSASFSINTKDNSPEAKQKALEEFVKNRFGK